MKIREFSKKYISVNSAAKSIMIYMNKMECSLCESSRLVFSDVRL